MVRKSKSELPVQERTAMSEMASKMGRRGAEVANAKRTPEERHRYAVMGGQAAKRAAEERRAAQEEAQNETTRG